MNITLVGFMGTGKTSVGKVIADRLGMTFRDMDSIIEENAGKPISQIFEEAGEPFFRTLERSLVEELCSQDRLVIATGGGVVLDNRNIRDFEKNGPVVCLSATPETILQRVSAETHRPLLEGQEKMRGIVSILDQRRQIYQSIRHQVDTTSLTVAEVAARVIQIAAAGDIR